MYKWYYCYDGDESEGWHGGYASKAQALAEGLAMATGYCKTITLCEACTAKVETDGVFDAETILEQLRDINDEISDEEGDIGLDEVSTEQAVELEVELDAVLNNWLARHKLDYSPYAFGDRRNEETHDVPPIPKPQ
jgi:hypothetical protein